MAGRPRRKKNVARKPAKPIARKRRVTKATGVEEVDPVAALRKHRECLEALLGEVRAINEATFSSMRALVETSMASAQELSAFLSEEIKKIDEQLPQHCDAS
jgi:hypothetical protein